MTYQEQSLQTHRSKSRDRNASGQVRTPDEALALQEVLKLLFNLTHLFPSLKQDFESTIEPIFDILSEEPLTQSPLQPPVAQLINALTSLDNTDSRLSNTYPEEDPSRNTDRLIQILDASAKTYQPEAMEEQAAPLILLIRRLYGTAPDDVKQSMQRQLLPTEQEREKPLGQSQSLFSRLLQLSMSSFTPSLRDSISGMMFELSDKDVDTFVKNVGFGYASGFLTNNGLPLAQPGSASVPSTNGTSARDVNPVTGQYLDSEKQDDGPPMTDEEKEREAERLFVLFERYV